MRVLEFEVKKQRVLKKPGCDFSCIVSGSVGYLLAKFHFSEEWNKCEKKVASFWLGDEEHAGFIDAQGCCTIPQQALIGEEFGVSLTGVGKDYKLTTNRIKIKQEVNRRGNC